LIVDIGCVLNMMLNYARLNSLLYVAVSKQNGLLLAGEKDLGEGNVVTAKRRSRDHISSTLQLKPESQTATNIGLNCSDDKFLRFKSNLYIVDIVYLLWNWILQAITPLLVPATPTPACLSHSILMWLLWWLVWLRINQFAWLWHDNDHHDRAIL